GVDKDRVGTDGGVLEAVAAVEAELGSSGRVLLRKSGTEPLVRVMVEADAQERAQGYADRLAGVVSERLAVWDAGGSRVGWAAPVSGEDSGPCAAASSPAISATNSSICSTPLTGPPASSPSAPRRTAAGLAPACRAS